MKNQNHLHISQHVYLAKLVGAGILAMLIIGYSFMAFSYTHADETEQQMQQTKKEILNVQKNIQNNKNKLEDIKKQKSTLETSLELLNTQIQTTELELKEIELQLEDNRLQIDDITRQMAEKEIELEKQEELLNFIIRTIYKEGNFSLIESIATSESLSSSLSQMSYLDIIKNRKESIISEIKVLQNKLEQNKTELEEKRAESESIKEKLEEKKLQLDMEQETKNKLLDQTKGEEQAYQETIKNDEQTRKELESSLKEMEAEIARQAKQASESSVYKEINNSASTSSNSFIQPVSGRITQGFWEPYPDYMFKLYPNLNKYHTGIDYGTAVGTPIKAPADGVVSMVKYSQYGYGNHVVLYHGNELFSLYGHLSSIMVEKGQKLSQGQVFAKTGNTGTSSGPHLHWEVRQYYTKNGSRLYDYKNPFSYL